MLKIQWFPLLILIATIGVIMEITGYTAPLGEQVVPRDAFPVFDNPKMLTAAEAERQGVIFEQDAVIGIQHGKEAKAYPITIMGVHELGNDTLDGIPIAVSW